MRPTTPRLTNRTRTSYKRCWEKRPVSRHMKPFNSTDGWLAHRSQQVHDEHATAIRTVAGRSTGDRVDRPATGWNGILHGGTSPRSRCKAPLGVGNCPSRHPAHGTVSIHGLPGYS